MTSKKILHKNYTTCGSIYQLKLPLDIEYLIPKDDSVRLLSQFVEELDLSELYQTYSRTRENQATPRHLLKIVLYGYMNGLYSSRKVEKACKQNINYMFLLEGMNAPDHSTIARFKSLHFSKVSKVIMAKFTMALYELGEISGETTFIDGTKIEANANKYTFVWTRAVKKHMAKRLQKAADLVADCEMKYGFRIVYKDIVKVKHLKKLRKKLYTIKIEEAIEFVHGCGKRKSELQKSIEELEEHLFKIKDYTHKIYVSGTRNSYSKTDTDATFMRMKEDHMRNGQLKPAYNLQHGVDAEYITWLTLGPHPTDTTTLKPFLLEMEEFLDFKYTKIVADAGYESEENYKFLKENNQLSFIKPMNYEISKTRKYKNDISRFNNMDYDKDTDSFTCKNNKKLIKSSVFSRKSKTGFTSEKTKYICEDCCDCPHKSKCMKGNNWKIPLEERTKSIVIAKEFIKYREDDLERIISLEGKELRMNRSIQAEGSFAQIKEDMRFRRYLSRGMENVVTESILIAIGHNINKFHNKIQGNRLGHHLYKLKKSS